MKTKDFFNRSKFQIFVEALKSEKLINDLAKDEQVKPKIKKPDLPFPECKTCKYNINGVCYADDITDCEHYNN